MRSVSGVMKTSTVLIAAGDGHEFFRSVQDVPQPLRQKLIESTTGTNSGTIVIADSEGRRQLSQALFQANGEMPQPASAARHKRLTFLAWMGVAMVLTLAGLFAAFFPMRW